MKLTKSIITTVIITLSAFTALFYVSCKSSCQHLTCFNGGSCSSGFCTCPYGYTGNSCEIPNTSSIQYYNHTFTPITLTVNNVAYTIPPHQIKGFSGKFGDSLKGNAFTRGQYGETINWDTVFNTFPINGSQLVDFDANPNYFYLFVTNDSASAVLREIVVDKGLSTERDIILPAPYLGYQSQIALGYFFATPTPNVYIKSAANDGQWYYSGSTLPLPNTKDQFIQVSPH